MTSGGIKMGMAPPHPGTFIRIEALEEPGLSVSAEHLHRYAKEFEYRYNRRKEPAQIFADPVEAF